MYNNWGIFVYQIWAALIYCKCGQTLGQTLPQIGAAQLSQMLSQIRTIVVTKYEKFYDKLEEVLQIRSISKNCVHNKYYIWSNVIAPQKPIATSLESISSFLYSNRNLCKNIFLLS